LEEDVVADVEILKYPLRVEDAEAAEVEATGVADVVVEQDAVKWVEDVEAAAADTIKHVNLKKSKNCF